MPSWTLKLRGGGGGGGQRLLLVALAVLVRSVSATGDEAAQRRSGLTDTSASPHVVMCSVGLNECRWTAGFWHDRWRAVESGSLPAMTKIMRGAEASQFLENFRVAAGLTGGRHRGPDWNDGDCFKWLEAVSAVYAVTHDVALRGQLDEAVEIIRRAQRSDGYLHTPTLIRARQGDSAAVPFENPQQFELYNLGHLMTAACVHHRATGERTLLEVAIKAADFLDATWESSPSSISRSAICPAHFMGLIELYRTTRTARYLELARRLIDSRGHAPGGIDDNQDRIPFREQTEAVGHAVRANYFYAGVADLYAETGDETLLTPLRSIWSDVTSRKMYLTGACGALFDGASPDGSLHQKIITRTHQAYGRPFQLPHSTAHNETCAAIGNVLWNWRMLQITGDSRFADVVELVLHNAALAGVSLDGTRYFYTNTLRQLDQMPVELRWSRNRQPFISCFCCPPNLVRTIGEVSNYAYGRSDDAVWVNLYGGSELDTHLAPGQRFRLVQTTAYPWDDRVQLEIHAAPESPCTMHVRIPAWCRQPTVIVNGREPSPRPVSGRYFPINRRWQPGDVVELRLPMPPRLIEAHPLVEESRSQVAVQRGPIVYCLESADLPPGQKLLNVVIPPDIKFRSRFDVDLLGRRGVCVLEGRAATVPHRGWSGQLYRDLDPTMPRSLDIRLIPYFAWGNRGPSEMSVWLPLGR